MRTQLEKTRKCTGEYTGNKNKQKGVKNKTRGKKEKYI